MLENLAQYLRRHHRQAVWASAASSRTTNCRRPSRNSKRPSSSTSRSAPSTTAISTKAKTGHEQHEIPHRTRAARLSVPRHAARCAEGEHGHSLGRVIRADRVRSAASTRDQRRETAHRQRKEPADAGFFRSMQRLTARSRCCVTATGRFAPARLRQRTRLSSLLLLRLLLVLRLSAASTNDALVLLACANAAGADAASTDRGDRNGYDGRQLLHATFSVDD